MTKTTKKSQPKQFDVMAVGNALVDHEYALSDEQLTQTDLTKGNMTLVTHEEQFQLLDQFKTLNLEPTKLAGGGSAANSMYALSSLGGQPFYACRVANDGAGEFYLQDLNSAGVATSAQAVQADETTGSCVVCVTPDGERTMQTYLGTSSDINEDNIDFDVLTNSQWLYLEGYLAMSPSMNQATTLLRQKAEENNVKVAVSFADPAVVKFAKDGLLNMLDGKVDVVFCNMEEAQLFTEQQNPKAAARALLAYTQTVVITNGGDATVIAHADEAGLQLSQVTTPVVDKVVDTNGAGDNYAGAFLYALTQNYSLQNSAKLAGVVASHVVQQFGPRLDAQKYAQIKESL